MAVRDDVGHRKHVAERFRHLLFVDEQMLDVHPGARELLVRRALALRDLVLVMRKDQVDAAAMKDRKSTRLNSSHVEISYAVFGLKKKNMQATQNSYIAFHVF